MGRRRRWTRVSMVVWLLPACLLTWQSSTRAQTTTRPTMQPQGTIADDPEEHMRRQMMEKLEKRRNDERQQQLVKDTNKLLALATELKTDVDKTNKDMLSVDVVKKADEIEKLAKSVKDRMRD